jgi:hypothetical protein
MPKEASDFNRDSARETSAEYRLLEENILGYAW